MRVVRCVNGDFFDADTYTVCPNCQGAIEGSSGSKEPSMVNKAKAQPRKGLFGKKKNQEEIPSREKINQGIDTTLVLNQPQMSDESFEYENRNHAPREMVATQNMGNGVAGVERTQSLWDDIREGGYPQNQPVNNINQPVPSRPMQAQPTPSRPMQAQPTPSRPMQAQPAPSHPMQAQPTSMQRNGEADKSSNSLSREIQNITASSEGKTVSYFNATMSAMNNNAFTNNMPNSQQMGQAASGVSSAAMPQAVSTYNANVMSEPVTGWIICVHGPHFGQCFNLEMGKNTIGRDGSNKIVINRDTSVSRDKHAIVVYEPKHKQFFLQPGDSSGLTYLNDEYITQSQILKQKDIIEIGNSRFIFIPLCGEDFSWEDYAGK